MKRAKGRIIRKRALSMLVALTMLFSSIELTAFATEQDPSSGMDTFTEETVTPEDSETTDETGQNENREETDGIIDSDQTDDSDESTGEEDSDKADDSDETQSPDGEDESGDSDETQDSDDEEKADDSDEIADQEEENESDKTEDKGNDEDNSEEEEVDESENIGRASVTVDNSNMSINASNALGSLFLDEIQAAAQEEQEEIKQSFVISDIEVTDKTAVVKIIAAEYCTVAVGIYEDKSEKPLAYGYAPVEIGTSRVSVEIGIDEMPAYFIVKAYIVDTDSLRPLSKEYTSTKYTQAMQEFLKKTTENFAPDKVVNLDEDIKTNFLVVKDDNFLIRAESGEEESITNELINYDEDTNTYTFSNVDENIKDLKDGDIFVYQYGENDFLVIKVKEISHRQIGEEEERETEEKEETEKTEKTREVYDIIAYEDELNVDDVFRYVKIEESMGTADMDEIDPNTVSCPEGVTYLGRDLTATYAIEGDVSQNISLDNWNLDLKKGIQGSHGPLEGTLDGEVGVSFGLEIALTYYFDVDVWAGFDCIWAVDFSITSELSATGQIDAEGKFSIPLFSTPQLKEGSILTIEYLPEFVIDMSFHGEINIGAAATFGVSFGDQENSSLAPDVEVTLIEVSAEVNGYIGVDFNPKLSVDGVFSAELESGVHLGVKASASAGISGSSDEETERHDCRAQCISGEVYLDVPFDGRLEVLKLREFDLGDRLNIEGSLIYITFTEFYYSIKHHDFGWGICPHKEYKTTFVVKTDAKSDIPNIPIEGAKVTVNGMNGTTDKNGMCIFWLPGGRYAFNAEYDGIKGKKSETIDDSKKITLYLNVKSKVTKFFGASAVMMLDGSLYTWGTNYYGQIGNGSTDIQTTPYKVMDNVRDAGSYGSVTYAITADGSLYMWGNNGNGQIGNGSSGTSNYQAIPYKVMDNVRDAGIYSDISYAITTDGSLYMWGNNGNGQIGNGSSGYSSHQLIPYKVLGNVRDIGVGDTTCYAITTDGSLYVWGYYYFGQNDLTSENIAVKYSPYKVLENVRDAGLSSSTIYAITTDGSLYVWGDNTWGQIGNGTSGFSYAQKIPYNVLDNVKEAGISSNNTVYAITTDGSLYMWGNNTQGQVGSGSSGNSNYQVTPYEVMRDVKDAGINDNYTSYAITTDGSLYMWGNNIQGQVGSGSSGNSNYQVTPCEVMRDVKDARLGIGTSYAITTDGSLYVWGANSVGQVGNDSTDDQYTPQKVLDNVKDAGMAGAISTISYAITTDGSLYMWGNNNGGYIGNGNTDNQYIPYKVQFSGATVASYTTQSINDVELAVSNTDEPIAVSLSTVHDADTIADNTATFSNLTPNDIYNIYVMKSKDAEEPLGSDNLFYIAQEVSDTSGNLSVDYGMTQAYENPVVFCVGFTQTDLSSAEVTVPDITYDGDAHYPEATVILGGQLLTEGTDYEIYGDCSVTDIGEYKILIKGIGTYCGEKEVTFRVIAGSGGNTPGGDDTPEHDDVLQEDRPENGEIPEGLWIAGIDEDGYAYTGSAIKPEVRVYDHKTRLVEKTDYTIAYKNNTKANDATVAVKAPTITVTGKGNYSGKETQTFKILPLDISLVDISQEDADKSDVFEADDISVVYNGKAQKPAPALYWNGKKLANKTDYTFTYHEGTYAGTDTEQIASVKETGDYYIRLTGNGNFTGTRRVALTVLPKVTEDSSVKPISKATVTKIPDQSYLTLGKDGVVTPGVTVKYGSETLEPGTHYTVAYSNNTKVGTAYAIITGIEKNGYSGTKRVSFKITGIAISKAKVNGLSGQTFLYTGADMEPALTLTVKLNGTDVTLVKDTDYSVTWQKNQNAGTAAVTFTGKNGYTGTLKKTFKIKAFNIAENKDGLFRAELKGKEELGAVSVAYAKGGAKPELTVTFQVNDGTPDGTQQTLTLKEGTDYTISYKNNKAVNDGSNTAKLPTLTIKGKGNFTGTYSQNLTYTITAQDLGELKLTAADKVYQNKKNIYTTKVTITDLDGKVLKAGTDYEKKLTYTYKNDTTLDNGTVRQAGEAVDKNDIIPTDTEICVTAASKGSSYTGTLSGEYSFKECDISGAKVTIPRQTYTGRKITLDKTDEKQILVKVKGKKVEPGQFDIVGYTNNVKKGTATVTIKGKGNYGGTKTVKFTIKAKGFLWWWKN